MTVTQTLCKCRQLCSQFVCAPKSHSRARVVQHLFRLRINHAGTIFIQIGRNIRKGGWNYSHVCKYRWTSPRMNENGRFRKDANEVQWDARVVTNLLIFCGTESDIMPIPHYLSNFTSCRDSNAIIHAMK